MLEIKNLHVSVDNTEIIKGISLTFTPGKVHALMGPNGSGKSTLAQAIMGHPKYIITEGQILLDGKDITHATPEDRAKAGLFLSFQYPSAITGVTIGKFLRAAVNTKRETPYSVVEFHALLKEKMAELHIPSSFSRRYLNDGFSGGEKKKAEMLQLMVLEPKYALLDETDSGLDVDAIRIVAEGINKVKKDRAIIVITHYKRFLEYLQPDEVSILYEGKIIKQGDADLAHEIEETGFTGMIAHA